MAYPRLHTVYTVHPSVNVCGLDPSEIWGFHHLYKRSFTSWESIKKSMYSPLRTQPREKNGDGDSPLCTWDAPHVVILPLLTFNKGGAVSCRIFVDPNITVSFYVDLTLFPSTPICTNRIPCAWTKSMLAGGSSSITRVLSRKAQRQSGHLPTPNMTCVPRE